MKKSSGLLVTVVCTGLVAALIGCGTVGTSNTESGRTATTSGERTTATGQPTTATGAMVTNKNPGKEGDKAAAPK